MKKILSFFIIVLMLITLMPTVALAADDPAVIGGTTGETVYNASKVFIAPTIVLENTGSTPLSAASIAITNLPGDCTIGYENIPAGIAVTVREDKRVVRLSGTASGATYQQALRGIYINTGTTAATVTFDISFGNALYNRQNQHYYEYVAEYRPWQDARDWASSKSYFGLQGYLATITSASENDFISLYCGGQGWLGASDADTENTWEWVTGPEAGTIFWRDGWEISGQYNNWQEGEPNESPPAGEDYMYLYEYTPSTPSEILGQWCDLHHTNPSVSGYFVEFGGMAGDPEVGDVNERCQLTIAPSTEATEGEPTVGTQLDSKVPNPKTGQSDFPWLWVVAAVVITVCGVLVARCRLRWK